MNCGHTSRRLTSEQEELEKKNNQISIHKLIWSYNADERFFLRPRAGTYTPKQVNKWAALGGVHINTTVYLIQIDP